ncbi:MAG: membrane protein insertase YidC, partial [Planctomycetia bacterium]
FASMVMPMVGPQDERIVRVARPQLLGLPHPRKLLSNVNVELESEPVELDPGAERVHAFRLFNGPKKESVLGLYEDYNLPLLIQYTNTLYVIPTAFVSQVMIRILNFFHGLVGDYGLAIILLTISVRLMMFPLSYKQTASMLKMQELAPQMKEIQTRYADDKEKMNRAVMDMYAANNVNPFMGCLPIMLQIPIFIGLWQTLYNSFTLRQSTFLWGYTWIDNLAAPDQLFPFGFDFPFLGPYFNLLPILTVIQMMMMFKMMSPPATTPEMEAQQRMMFMMMPMFGLMGYWLPAGLCLYIITSSLWSVLERQVMPKPAKKTTDGAPVVVVPASAESRNGAADWIKAPPKGKKSRR